MKTKTVFMRTPDGEAEEAWKELGYKTTVCEPKEMKKLGLSKDTPVTRSIYAVRMGLWLLGLEQPKNVDIPYDLRKYTHRRIWKSTLGEVRKWGGKVHIKPLLDQKAFSGRLYEIYYDSWTGESREDHDLNKFSNSFPVLVQERVTWETECRAYVMNGKILSFCDRVDSSDRKLKEEAREMVQAWRAQPVAWCLDFGIIKGKEERKVALVEVNEGFACGNYGVPGIILARMGLARWNQMVGIKR